jgi:hypothetical protein
VNSCPHCNSQLRDFWWETQLPQSKWTQEQTLRTQAKREALDAYRRYTEGYAGPLSRDRDP